MYQNELILNIHKAAIHSAIGFFLFLMNATIHRLCCDLLRFISSREAVASVSGIATVPWLTVGDVSLLYLSKYLGQPTISIIG